MKTLRYLMSVAMLLGANALLAQTPAGTPKPVGPDTEKGQMSAGEVSTAQQTIPCQHIITECKKLGFLQGDANRDNGIWVDCFDPVVRGGKATRDGKSISVPVSPADLKECKAAVLPPKG